MDAYTFGIDMVATGKRIRTLRILNGLRVTDISSYMGFEDPQAVYKWQSGKSLPNLGNMIALAKLFKTPIESIVVLTGEEHDSSPVVINDELEISAA